MNHEPDSIPDEKARILLLAGFLGSGKTTLLKRILSWETDLSNSVVLVNEFGDIGIDGALLKDSGSDVIELTSGCICCTLSADLKRSLEDIWNRFRPKRIFIESSGVADPAAVVTALREPLLMRSMRIGKVITVLDADFWEAREVFGPLFYSQLEMADLILLNKIDTQEKEKIPQYLKEMHEVLPDTQVVPTIRCNIDSDTLWTDVDARKRFESKPTHVFKEILLEGEVPHESDGSHGHHEDDGKVGHTEHGVDAGNFVTFSFQDRGEMDESCFKEFVAELPWELFRMKGPVRFKENTMLINFVGGRSEWVSWEGDEETRLAFIGWDVDAAAILKKLKECLIDL
jgi:G3E family GTPase